MQPWWTDFPWRAVQSNFCEIDTLHFNADAFLEHVSSLHANIVVLNAAGIIASYPSELEDHPVSEYLDGFDLKSLVDRCHAMGLKVIARTDFSKIQRSVYERHPDWAYRLADGSVIDYNGYVHTCLNAGYQNGYMDKILTELLTKIPFDGVYCNMGTFSAFTTDYSYRMYGACRCEACKQGFRERYGLEIPAELKRDDKASMLFGMYQREVSAAQKKRIAALIHKINPDIAYCSVDYLRQEENSEYGRGPFWQYAASDNARAMRGMSPNAVACDTDMMGFYHRWVSVTPALQELRLWQSLANFAGLDYYVFGRLDTREDTSAYERVAKVFGFAEKHADIVSGGKSLADILLIKETYQYPNAEERGWIRILTENHFPFDETLSGGVSKIDLNKYSLIILPDKGRLDPKTLEALKSFVHNGGTLLASGNLPKNLEDLFGVTGLEPFDDTVMGACVRILSDDLLSFPSFTDRKLVPVGKAYQKREYAEGTVLFGGYEAPQRFGPPEACYATEPTSAYPAVSVASRGTGSAVSIPWMPGTCYYEEGLDIWERFLTDLLNAAGCNSISKNVSPMAEVTYGIKDEKVLLQFVNGTGHFGKSYFDPAPLYDQTVTIPWDRDSATAIDIETPGNATAVLENGYLTVTLKKLDHYACITVS